MEEKVLAEVNGKKLTEKDVLEFINMINGGYRFNNEQGIKQIANEMINQELLYIDAKEKELDKDEEFNKILEDQKKNLLKNYAMEKLFEGIEVSEQEAKDYYDNNTSLFKSPMMFHAKHILVDDEEKAKEIKKEIDEGKTFEDLAKEYSKDGSAQNGGDLGEFPEGSMVKEFEDKLKEMEEGEISDPVKTQFGYHLIKLDHKHDRSIYKFDDIKKDLLNQLVMMKRQERYIAKTNKLKENIEVKTYF